MHYGSVERRARRFPKDIDIQVRCVCVSCNNGWMEAMESEVKPIIESLLGSGSHTLNQSEQFSLAKWAVKTAIIARYYAGKHEVPPMYRRWFYQNQVALPNSFVWVGTYDDELAATLESKDMALNSLSFPHVQFVVFTVRRVLIAVLIAYVPSKLILEPSPLIREHLRIISPFGDDIIWPLNPLDKERRLAIFQSSWDDGLLFEVERFPTI